MTKEELKIINETRFNDLSIPVADFVKEDKTLVYGYTFERSTFHLYSELGRVVRLVYGFNQEVLDYREYTDHIPVGDCCPNKRAYPERCDFEFIKMVIRMGGQVQFTNYSENIPLKKYYGITHISE